MTRDAPVSLGSFESPRTPHTPDSQRNFAASNHFLRNGLNATPRSARSSPFLLFIVCLIFQMVDDMNWNSNLIPLSLSNSTSASYVFSASYVSVPSDLSTSPLLLLLTSMLPLLMEWILYALTHTLYNCWSFPEYCSAIPCPDSVSPTSPLLSILWRWDDCPWWYDEWAFFEWHRYWAIILDFVFYTVAMATDFVPDYSVERNSNFFMLLNNDLVGPPVDYGYKSPSPPYRSAPFPFYVSTLAPCFV